MSNDKTSIIHISDIHYGRFLKSTGAVKSPGLPHKEEYISTIDVLFLNWLDKKIPIVDRKKYFLVVTGDMSSDAKDSEFKQFFEFLDKTKIPKEQIIITVGNHDVNRNASEFKERFDNFNTLAHRSGVLTPFEEFNEYKSCCRYYPDSNILFYCLNSVQWLSGVDDEEIVKITNILKANNFQNEEVFEILDRRKIIDAPIIGNHLHDLEKNLNKELEKFSVKDDSEILKIAIVHHHVNPVPNTEVRNFDIICDSGPMKNRLRNLNFDLVLHGHKHLPYLSTENIYDKTITKPDLHIFGAGTLSGETDTGNSFNVIEILDDGKDKDVNLERYKLSSAGEFYSEEKIPLQTKKSIRLDSLDLDPQVAYYYNLKKIEEDRTLRKEYGEYMNNAGSRIWVLSTSMHGFQQDHKDKLLPKALEDVDIKFLVIDPEVHLLFNGDKIKMLEVRDLEEGNLRGGNEQRVNDLINMVNSINKRIRNKGSDNFIQVKGYRSLPHTMLFFIDDVLYFGPYLHKTSSIKCLTFKAQSPGALYRRYESHFKELWDDKEFTRTLV